MCAQDSLSYAMLDGCTGSSLAFTVPSPIESFLIHSRNIPFLVLITGHSALINVVLVFPKNLRNAESEFDCQWELSENAIP